LQYAAVVAADDPLRTEAERLLWRYVVEVVERFALCPWARRARERGEVRVEVLTGAAPTFAEVAAAAARIAETSVMGMIVLPRARPDAAALRRLRDALVAARAGRAPAIGIADFHPDAAVDLTSAARAVPGLRRAPDPTLQLVRLDALASARGAPPPASRADQAAILAGVAAAPALPVSDQIAADNLRTARADVAAIDAAVAAIHADRDAAYARLGEVTASSR